MSTLAKAMSSKYELLQAIITSITKPSAYFIIICLNLRAHISVRVLSLLPRPSRVPAGGGPAAGVGRQGGQPEPSPAAGEGGGGARRQSGAAAGEQGWTRGGAVLQLP